MSLPSAVRSWWRPGARFVVRTGHRTLVESLYLLTAPVTAAAGILLVIGGLCVGTVGMLLPRGSPVVAGVLAAVRWPADVEWWRIAKVRPPAVGLRPRPKQAPASDPGVWLGVVHAVAAVPVAVVTSLVTGLWWFVGLGAATLRVRVS